MKVSRCFFITLASVIFFKLALAEEATLIVTGSALVFEDKDFDAPDDLGAFSLGLHLPEKELRAENCHGDKVLGLLVGIVGRTNDFNNIPRTSLPEIEKHKAYYAFLKHAKEADQAVSLHMSGSAESLQSLHGVLDARHCIVNLDIPANFQ